MNIVPLAEVKARFSTYIQKTQQGPVIVTKNGRAVAVMLNVKNDDDLERILLANSPRLQAILADAEKRIQATGGVKHEEMWAMIESEPQEKPKPARAKRKA
jgi:prevent-host-death family protein